MSTNGVGPYGIDLTGQVNILLQPNESFPWVIGTGAFTDVFKGEWTLTSGSPSKLVAIKIFRPNRPNDTKGLEDTNRRLERESDVWSQLEHPNVQPYYGHCHHLGLSTALITPLCTKGTLMDYMERNGTTNAFTFVKEIAEGLKYLHGKEIIHADLQSNNVLIDEEGHARLCDFGRAKIVGEAKYSTKLIAGCAPYMAPELMPEDEGPETNVDQLFTYLSDVYAFGMLTYEILTGSLPFKSMGVIMAFAHGRKELRRPKAERGRYISDTAWEIMKRCWVKEPESRIRISVPWTAAGDLCAYKDYLYRSAMAKISSWR